MTKYQKASYQLLSAQVWTNGRDLYIPPGMMRLGYLIYLAITMPCYLGPACLSGHSTSGLCASHRLQTWRACQDTHGEALCMTFGEGGEGKWASKWIGTWLLGGKGKGSGAELGIREKYHSKLVPYWQHLGVTPPAWWIEGEKNQLLDHFQFKWKQKKQTQNSQRCKKQGRNAPLSDTDSKSSNSLSYLAIN